MNNNQNQNLLPVASFVNECKICGEKFRADNEKETLCLIHRVAADLKLPYDETIINVNLLNIWQSGNYDKEKGVDRLLSQVAEGVIPLDTLTEDERKIYSTITTIRKNVSNENIEGLLKKYIENKSKHFDLLVVLKYSKDSDFSVYGIRYSKRMISKLKDKSILFKKKFAISLVVAYETKKAKGANKK